MKFLVLALCVCAASAASFGFKPQQYQPQQYQPQQVAKAFAQTAATPFIAAPVAVSSAAYTAAQAVATAPIVAAKTVYNAGKEVYNKGQEYSATILRSDSEVNSDGFKYGFETDNGIAAQAYGVAKKVDDAVVLGFEGSYRYIAPDGTPVEITYTADENGYKPQGNVLPVAPPVPEAILRSIEYIRTHAKPENYN